VVRIDRLARWRPAWDVDVELNGTILPLHARGERELNFAIPYRIADEVPCHNLLEGAGLPVPHAYGICDYPYALVMDRLPGLVDLSFADSDEQRAALIDEYLEILARIYDIDIADVTAAGFAWPTDARQIALGSFMNFEAIYDQLMPRPEPVAEFLRRWLHRNYPRDRAVARFVTYDAFQFMFDHGRITGLLDFELAHVGDPMMDVAALRVRDTIKNLGDLAAIAERYAEVTGYALDHEVIDYHTVLYNTLTVLSAAPPLAAPERTTDVISHMAWTVNSARWAFQVMAEMLGFELAPVEALSSVPTPHAPTYAHLTRSLRAMALDDPGSYELSSLGRVARYLVRIDESGPAAGRADLDDLEHLLGYRPDGSEADTALLDFISTAGPERDEDLVRLLDRRVQRAHLLMAPPGALLLRHPRLRSLRRGAAGGQEDPEGWPPGVIPGTR
jgi:aminoglycoside phosphotransferase (APT) family kinase protein